MSKPLIMPKRIITFLITLTILICVCFSGCFENVTRSHPPYDFSNEDTGYAHKDAKDPEGLAPELVLQIRKDYMQLQLDHYRQHDDDEIYEYYANLIHLKDIWIFAYIGNYSGCELLYMADLRPIGGLYIIEIAGYIIAFAREPYVYKDTKLYTLEEAFDAGFITKEGIYEIGMKVDRAFAENNNKS